MENKERKETINKFARVNISKLWEKRTLRTFHTFFNLGVKKEFFNLFFYRFSKVYIPWTDIGWYGVMNTIKHYIIEKTRLCNVL